MFEHRNEPLISRQHFVHRMVRHGLWGLLIVGGSLAVGVVGYHSFARFSWIDSLLNASMLLGGMGPVGDLPNDAAKVFASVFALYSGIVFLVLAGLLLGPVFHRVLHRFHWEADQEEQS